MKTPCLPTQPFGLSKKPLPPWKRFRALSPASNFRPHCRVLPRITCAIQAAGVSLATEAPTAAVSARELNAMASGGAHRREHCLRPLGRARRHFRTTPRFRDRRSGSSPDVAESGLALCRHCLWTSHALSHHVRARLCVRLLEYLGFPDVRRIDTADKPVIWTFPSS